MTTALRPPQTVAHARAALHEVVSHLADADNDKQKPNAKFTVAQLTAHLQNSIALLGGAAGSGKIPASLPEFHIPEVQLNTLGELSGSGSLSRSAINYQSGAATRFSGIVSAAKVTIALPLFAPLLRYIPQAALAGLLLVTAVRLVDFRRLAHAVKASPVRRGVAGHLRPFFGAAPGRSGFPRGGPGVLGDTASRAVRADPSAGSALGPDGYPRKALV